MNTVLQTQWLESYAMQLLAYDAHLAEFSINTTNAIRICLGLNSVSQKFMATLNLGM